MAGQEWARGGRCAEVDPEMFFPQHGNTALARFAKRICGSCEIREACLHEAMNNPDLAGIWGGTDQRQRKNMRRLSA